MVKIYPITADGIAPIIEEIFQDFKPPTKNEKVLIKPNILGPFKPEQGVTTAPEVIAAIVDQVEKIGAGEIIVSDSQGGIYGNIMKTAEITGIKAASKGYFRAMNDAERVEIPLNSTIVPSAPVAKFVTEVDYLINAPRFKTHTLTTITGCVKNMFGLMMGNLKMTVHRAAPSLQEFHNIMVDIYEIRKPDLNIVDSITVMEGNGPTHGKLRKTDLIIAGENGVETDAVMTAMMGLEPASIIMLAEAKKRGLGEIDLNKIDIRGPFAPIKNFKTPSTTISTLQSWGNLFTPLVSVVPVTNKPKCIKCGQCVRNCPAQAIALTPYPKINRKKCIHCFCCAELCPEGALDIPGIGRNLFRKILGL